MNKEYEKEIKKMEQKLELYKKIREKLSSYFDFIIPDYVISDFIDNEDYHHFCLMVNMADFNYEEWNEKYHNKKFIDLFMYFSSEQKELLKKFDIIPAEIFDKAQTILSKRCGARETGRRKGNYSRKYSFSSRIFCGFCGSVYVRRNLYSSTPYSKRVWQCMEYVKSGKTNCVESKVLREDIIESCFAEAYQLLCKNNKDVIKRFLERIENLLSDDKIKSAIRKLKEQKTQLETKLDSLLNLMIDGTIDKEIFKNKKIEINKKIKKADEEIERLECQLQDEKSFDDGFKKINQFFKSNDVNDESFDKDVFEALIYKVVIGEKDKDGNCNPYVIRFIIKNGTEDNYRSRNEGIMNTLLEDDNLILDFESFQKFVSFHKQEDGSLRKNLETKVRVKVEMNNGI